VKERWVGLTLPQVCLPGPLWFCRERLSLLCVDFALCLCAVATFQFHDLGPAVLLCALFPLCFMGFQHRVPTRPLLLVRDRFQLCTEHVQGHTQHAKRFMSLPKSESEHYAQLNGGTSAVIYIHSVKPSSLIMHAR